MTEPMILSAMSTEYIYARSRRGHAGVQRGATIRPPLIRVGAQTMHGRLRLMLGLVWPLQLILAQRFGRPCSSVCCAPQQNLAG